MSRYSVAGPDGRLRDVTEQEFQAIVDQQVLQHAQKTRISFQGKTWSLVDWAEEFDISHADLVIGLEQQRSFEEILAGFDKIEPCTCGQELISANLKLPAVWPRRFFNGKMIVANPKCSRCHGHCFVRKDLPPEEAVVPEPMPQKVVQGSLFEDGEL